MTRYELAERIGVGAMAEIFRGKAIAAGGFEKPVAIKRILPHLSQDRRFVELLIAEANILSYLRHRNIVQIFDVGIGPDGQYFLVMEYVDGVDLGALQAGMAHARVRLPVDLGLYIGSDVCEALEYAHSQARGPDGEPLRLVHRDVSPTNVLLSRSGEVKLTDFGIAKRAEEVTTHGGVRGKFAYISPEQAAGHPVNARSDVFSVGIVLFELLLGTPLFARMADFDAMRAIVEGRVPRPRELYPGIDPRLDALLCKALALRPGDRFSSAGELGKELRSLRYSLPATSGDPATEIGALLERSVLGGARTRASSPASLDEPTVVSLAAPPGFGSEATGVTSRTYADARQILVSFEKEASRSRTNTLLPGSQQESYDTINHELDLRALEVGLSTDSGADEAKTSVHLRALADVPGAGPDEPPGEGSLGVPPAQQADRERGQGHGSEWAAKLPAPSPSHAPVQPLDTVAPAPVAAAGSAGRSLPPPVRDIGRVETIATLGGAAPASAHSGDSFEGLGAAPITATASAARRTSLLARLSRRQRVILLSLGLAATSAGSFVIAAAVLRGDGRISSNLAPAESGPPPPPDAGPPPMDAAPPDAAVDAAAPAKEPKPKKRSRRKRSRK